MANLSDLALATQVAVFHNKQAFDQLVRKHQSPVRRFLLSLTGGNEALSDDLAQDTFLKAYVNMSQFRGSSSIQTWLMRIAYNTYYDHRRRSKDNTTTTLPPAAEGGREEPTAGLRMDIQRALMMLREEERTCISLQLIEGYPIDEIAHITSMPTNTVKSHLRRGKEKLTNYLKENGYDNR